MRRLVPRGRGTRADAACRRSCSPGRRLALLGIAVAVVTCSVPAASAAAEPKPELTRLKKQVERLYEEIETLTEEYNGQRVRLAEAKRTAARAKEVLRRSEADLAAKREKAGLLAQHEYMTGGISPLALIASDDPATFLDRAATTYALTLQQNQEVVQLAEAMRKAERAKTAAVARQAEVDAILKDLAAKRRKIQRMIAQTESDLFREARTLISGGRAVRVDIPIPGKGKAAAAARWALTQQLKPYRWGAGGPYAFDCSGLVMWAYRQVGISLPHYTGSQWTAGTRISRKDLRPGDLVFFYSDLHHVGIYIGGGMMVHAPRTGDVVRVAPIGNRPFAGAVRIAD